jgi:transcriptional regulator with XRE-family HTH domain
MELTPKEHNLAYWLWYQNFAKENWGLERELDPLLDKEINPARRDWLRKTRNALQVSAATVAKKLKTSRSAYSQIEESEVRGAISLNALARAAEAMDCELVYAIRPKKKVRFSKIIWDKLLPSTLRDRRVRAADPRQRPQVVGAVATQMMEDPRFRKLQRWSQR